MMRLNTHGRKGIIALLVSSLLMCVVFSGGCRISQTYEKSVLEDNNTTYYSLKMVPTELDIESITKSILGESALYYDQAMPMELAPGNAGRYELHIENDNMLWSYNESKSDYFFWRKSEGEIISEEQGQKLADEIVSVINMQLGNDMEISENINVYYDEGKPNQIGMIYTLMYKNISILDNRSIASTMDCAGMWIDFSIDSKGIKCVSICRMMQVIDELESYTMEDFVTEDVLRKVAENYCRKVVATELDNTSNNNFEGSVSDVQIIYIPTKEEDEIIWIPAFKVLYTFKIGNEERWCELIIDAYDGYVYNWTGSN